MLLLPRSPSFPRSTSISLHSIIALHLTAFQLSFSISHSSLMETLNRALSFSILPSASLSIKGTHLKSFSFAQDQTVYQKKDELDTEHLFTLDFVGRAPVHLHRTRLSFSLSDRDNPLSNTTSGFLQCPWLRFQKAS